MHRLVVAALLLGLIPFATGAQQKNRVRSIADTVKANSAAVVLIETTDKTGNPLAQGSGFIVSADGKIVTNFHVIEGADSALVKMSNGAFLPVRGVLAESEEDDLALIKVSGSGLPMLRLADAKTVAVGDRVIAMGSPLGLEGTVTDGIVSALRELDRTNTPLIQTTAPISHGSSGGPLLDIGGKVVGILTFKFSEGENLNFAVGIDALKSLIVSAHPLTPLKSAVAADGQPRKDSLPPANPTSKPEVASVICPPLLDYVEIYETPERRIRVAILFCGDAITVLSRNEDKIGMDRIRDRLGHEGYVYDSEVTESKLAGQTETRQSASHPPADPRELPPAELAKVTCSEGVKEQVYITGDGVFLCKLYNGSDWPISEITVLLTFNQNNKEALTRRYRVAQGYFFDHSGTHDDIWNIEGRVQGWAHAAPLSTEYFATRLEFTPERGQAWTYKIVGAKKE